MSPPYSMKRSRTNLGFLLAVLLFTLALAARAQAADVKVDCNKKNASINAMLATLSKQGPNTIHVSGACYENVIIDGYEDLTLLASPDASLNDPTPTILHDNDVVDISGSRNITVQGFTINGGDSGVACGPFSVCYLRNLTIKDATNVAVFFYTSSGYIDNTTIQDAASAGLVVTSRSWVWFGSGAYEPGTATIQNNGTFGIQVGDASYLILAGATVQGHSSHGVTVRWDSNLRLLASTITGNGGIGVDVGPSAVARMQQVEITGNGGNGVALSHLSILQMITQVGNAISGNGQPDIRCKVETAKTEGTGGAGAPNFGGTTNCIEPAP